MQSGTIIHNMQSVKWSKIHTIISQFICNILTIFNKTLSDLLVITVMLLPSLEEISSPSSKKLEKRWFWHIVIFSISLKMKGSLLHTERPYTVCRSPLSTIKSLRRIDSESWRCDNTLYCAVARTVRITKRAWWVAVLYFSSFPPFLRAYHLDVRIKIKYKLVDLYWL